MSTIIDKEQVGEVAALAKIGLQGNELDELSEAINEVLGYCQRLKGLDVGEAAAMERAIAVQNAFREDEVRESLSVDEVLGNAPQHDGQSFVVPRILDEDGGA